MDAGFSFKGGNVRMTHRTRAESQLLFECDPHHFGNGFLPTAHSEAMGRPPVAIGVAKQLPTIDTAGMRKRRARTKSSRALPSRNCASGTPQTLPAILVRFEKLAPCLASRLALHASPTIYKIKIPCAQRNMRASEKRHLNRIDFAAIHVWLL